MRLQDRAMSAFQERRRQAAEGSTRFRDRAQTAFQRRRQQAQRAKEAVVEQTGEFAEALDLDPGNIEPVQLDERGEEIGFVPDERGVDILAGRFAEEREFVEPGDALVNADARTGVETLVDPAARDAIGQRAKQGVAGEDPYAEPGDLDVDVDPAGVESVGFTPMGERRRAGRQFAAETPLDTVAPDDIRETDDGFGLTAGASRRLAAREFETDIDQFGRGELDPATDIRELDDGFGLARGPARQAVAADIDAQIPEVDIGPDDIGLEETDSGGFRGVFEREVRR